MSGRDEKKQYERLSEFYDGKSLFITGAAGFLGSVLLEVFLRCLPGVKNIFILLRPKRGASPQERLKIIFQKKLFGRLLEENPNALEKVIVIQGDVTELNLGMSDENFVRVTNEATIIFHVAAAISFMKPQRYLVRQNCVGLNNVIELARKLKKLEILVYTSTAFSNANRSRIEETIYRLPWTGERFLKALESNVDGEFEMLVADCKPDWPNHYTFSKCLAENILADEASDLPVVIVRPSIIIGCWKAPLQGYLEQGFGAADFPLSYAKGFARVTLADKNSRLDIVPVDIAANTHVVAAWSVATKRMPSLSVINCTGGPWYISVDFYMKTWKKTVDKCLMPQCFQKPGYVIVNSVYLYKLLTFYEHYIPAYTFQIIHFLQRSKHRLVNIYKCLDEIVYQLYFFTKTTFDFKMGNYIQLEEQMDPRDKEIFSLKRDDIDLDKMIKEVPNVSACYDWKVADNLLPKERKKILLRHTYAINFIKSVALILLGCILYSCLRFIFALML